MLAGPYGTLCFVKGNYDYALTYCINLTLLTVLRKIYETICIHLSDSFDFEYCTQTLFYYVCGGRVQRIPFLIAEALCQTHKS